MFKTHMILTQHSSVYQFCNAYQLVIYNHSTVITQDYLFSFSHKYSS